MQICIELFMCLFTFFRIMIQAVTVIMIYPVKVITEDSIPNRITNKQFPIEKSIPKIGTNPNNIEGTTIAVLIFHAFLIR